MTEPETSMKEEETVNQTTENDSIESIIDDSIAPNEQSNNQPITQSANLQKSCQFLFTDRQRSRDETTDDGISPYMLQRRHFYTDEKWALVLNQLKRTSTLYVGNLSFYTTEEQLYEYFGLINPRIKQLIMGLNQMTLTPCGFAFVLYDSHDAALACQRHMSGTMCDERTIRADLDIGFEEGRQFGRSKMTCGQTRDDHRQAFDPGRGGYVVTQKTTYATLTHQANHPSYYHSNNQRSNKKQRIDLSQVRATRVHENAAALTAGQPIAHLIPHDQANKQSNTQPNERVGSKRRRDDDDDMVRDDQEEEDSEIKPEPKIEEDMDQEEQSTAA